MQNKIFEILQIRAGETLLVTLIAALFFFWEGSREFGNQTATTLFISRAGADNLPYMYIALGLGNIIITSLYSAGMAYFKPRVYFSTVATLLLAAPLVQYYFVPRGAILTTPESLWQVSLIFPVFWLTVQVGGSVIATIQWSIAGQMMDTRQAKRLFSLLASAGLVGAVSAAALARTLAVLYRDHIANLIFWQAGFLAFGLLVLQLLWLAVPRPIASPAGKRQAFLSGLRAGAATVRYSPLLRLVAFSLIVFSILFLTIDLLYNQIVNAAFQTEATKLNYFATISGTIQLLTLAISIFLTGRLVKRFGVVNANFFLVLAYAIGFLLLLWESSLANATIARILQLATLGGIVQSSNYIFFNAIPPEKRGQALSFTFGVVGQIGVILSGLLLLWGDRVAQGDTVLVIGLLLAILAGGITFRMRSGYRQALVTALQSGQMEVFSAEQGLSPSLQALQTDPAALRLLTQSLNEKNPLTRRLALEILAELKATSSLTEIILRMADTDADVRRAALGGLMALGYEHTGRWAIEALHDPSNEVCIRALECLGELKTPLAASEYKWIAELSAKAEMPVRLAAIRTLAVYGVSDKVRAGLQPVLRSPDSSERTEGAATLGAVFIHLRAIGQTTEKLIPPREIRRLLHDPDFSVRREACLALVPLTSPRFLKELLSLLRDEHLSVRLAAAKAIRALGPASEASVLSVLFSETGGDLLEAALLALSPDKGNLQDTLQTFAQAEIKRLATLRQRADSLRLAGPTAQLLMEATRADIARGEIRLIRVLQVIEPEDNLEWEFVIAGLKTGEPARRAAIIEMLDTLGDTTIAKELVLPALEDAALTEGYQENETFLNPSAVLRESILGGDRWTQALAIAAAAEINAHNLTTEIARLRRSRDPLIRETVQFALTRLKKGKAMARKALQTLSSVERIVLLREVPLFQTLEINDLKQLAELASEQLFHQGDYIVRQGEQGDQLYIIASGDVEIWLNTGRKEEQVALGKTGDFFGEMAVLETAPRSASIRAHTPVRALVIDGDPFKAILRDRPEVALTVLRGLSQRIRRANELLSDSKHKQN